MHYFGVGYRGRMGPHGQPKRCPSRARVDVLSSNLRMAEYLADEKAEEDTEGANAKTARSTRSICHDVLPSHRARDYQDLGGVPVSGLLEVFGDRSNCYGNSER